MSKKRLLIAIFFVTLLIAMVFCIMEKPSSYAQQRAAAASAPVGEKLTNTSASAIVLSGIVNIVASATAP